MKGQGDVLGGLEAEGGEEAEVGGIEVGAFRFEVVVLFVRERDAAELWACCQLWKRRAMVGGSNILWTWASSQRNASRVKRICGVRLVKAYVTSGSCWQRSS